MFRAFWGAVPKMMRGLPTRMPRQRHLGDLSTFMEMGNFNGADDCGRRGKGFSPLHCAAKNGDSQLVRQLVEAHANPNRCYQGGTITEAGVYHGEAPLSIAVSSMGDLDSIRLLVQHRADHHQKLLSGCSSPLHEAAAFDAAGVGIRSLAIACRERGLQLDVDTGIKLNSARPLNWAAYLGSLATLRTLLEHGANPRHIDDNGGFILTDLVQNKTASIACFDCIWSRIGDTMDINLPQTPRTRKWIVINFAFQTVLRAGGPTVRLCATWEIAREPLPFVWFLWACRCCTVVA